MPTTVKKVWLEDKDGAKIAPKTLVSQIQTSDGVLLEDKLHADLDALKEEVLEETQTKIEEHNVDTTAHSDIRNMADAALPKTGGTMTGAITLPGAPTEALHAATKQYVDDNKYTHPSTHPASMITGLTDIISGLGYSKIVTGSYTGNGARITRQLMGNDPNTYEPLYKYTGGQTIALGFTPNIVVIFGTNKWSIVHITQNIVYGETVYKSSGSTGSTYYIATLSGAELSVGGIDATNQYSWNQDTNQNGYSYYWLAF